MVTTIFTGSTSETVTDVIGYKLSEIKGQRVEGKRFNVLSAIYTMTKENGAPSGIPDIDALMVEGFADVLVWMTNGKGEGVLIERDAIYWSKKVDGSYDTNFTERQAAIDRNAENGTVHPVFCSKKESGRILVAITEYDFDWDEMTRIAAAEFVTAETAKWTRAKLEAEYKLGLLNVEVLEKFGIKNSVL